MKIFIISDLHANFEALSLLPSDYDELWVLGDLVNYGPDPALTIEFVRLRASMVVRGNHDNAVGYGSDYRCSPRFQRMAEAMGSYTRSMLSAEDKQYLRGLPACARRRVGSQVFFLCHATPSDLLYDYRLPDFAAVARRRGGQFRRRYNPSRPYSSSIHAHLRIPHGAQSSEPRPVEGGRSSRPICDLGGRSLQPGSICVPGPGDHPEDSVAALAARSTRRSERGAQDRAGTGEGVIMADEKNPQHSALEDREIERLGKHLFRRAACELNPQALG